ncbi:MAG: Rrf2 family transcriptional regulator [Eggerthellaceae bacterium]|nr:Rrf2 family transcriptional regulator [Eggerthellaceae bacterium]
MQLKASTDYGLRAVLYLAAANSTCSSKDIAEDMSIPRDYLIQLAQLLRNAGIIEARPGKHGGYRLAKDPSEITLLQIIEALDEDAKETTRARRRHRRTSEMAKNVKNSYELVLESYDASHESITLDMLLDCCNDESRGREFIAERLSDESRRLLMPAMKIA